MEHLFSPAADVSSNFPRFPYLQAYSDAMQVPELNKKNSKTRLLQWAIPLFILFLFTQFANAKDPGIPFKVLAFYTAKNDQAHISFVHEANRWFARIATQNNFSYDSTSNWGLLNGRSLSKYQVILFLDTRPEDPAQRAAFQAYMEHGGAWMGFHFAAFALANSAYPENWDWYHNTFLGAGAYASNTWRPTSATLRVETPDHISTRHLKPTFNSAPNEWYRWSKDLRLNKDIKILLSIDSSSFPLGTGPKPSEIWHSGYYPVAWTNTRYRMLYMNMGHNDIDYEHNSKKELSFTFDNVDQNTFILNSILWLGHRTSDQFVSSKQGK